VTLPHAPEFVYGCTTLGCSERLRGFTDEDGLFCLICLQDLTEILNPDGLTLDNINVMAELAQVTDA
jgi:hypothetical protein